MTTYVVAKSAFYLLHVLLTVQPFSDHISYNLEAIASRLEAIPIGLDLQVGNRDYRLVWHSSVGRSQVGALVTRSDALVPSSEPCYY